ncbi:MAG: prolipoprotein diacylglyceryl transferase, partial [Verrucomicrobiales bacterium]
MSAPRVFATYVHDLNPVLFRVNEAIALRWYGLAYLGAFLVGAWLLNVLSKRKLWVLPPGSAADFIAAAAIFGVFIGGRLGYMLWYYPRAHGWSWVMDDPLLVFKVWEGGMASHGGILGLVVFTWFYARKKGVSWFGLGDGLCVVAPLGLMFGRLANFINGELYGRVAEGVAWAMKFPNTLLDRKMPESEFFGVAVNAAAGVDETLALQLEQMPDAGAGLQMDWLQEAQWHNPAVSEAIAPFLEPRHPSQLYQASLEGALLFLILWGVRIRYPQAPHGLLTGLFFIFYAVFRIIGEMFREPDSKLVVDGVMTSGQCLSAFMILGGFVFIGFA